MSACAMGPCRPVLALVLAQARGPPTSHLLPSSVEEVVKPANPSLSSPLAAPTPDSRFAVLPYLRTSHIEPEARGRGHARSSIRHA
eukprot:scaffold263417_cov35-Tisochrysis_lutea.AAC.1